MYLPWVFPKNIEILWFEISQTLVTSFVATIFFLLFIAIYSILKWKNSNNSFVMMVDIFVEWMVKFFEWVWAWIPKYAMNFVLFIFFYLFRVNMFWLFWDLFAVVIPSVHWWFRPVATDIFFNLILAISWVFVALFYWFQKNGLHFIEKFVPYKWVWLSWEVNSFKSFMLKFADVAIWLFVWILETISEIAKILSLTLRLFWNIFAWVILITLSIYFMPVWFPVPIMIFEVLVSFLQAFVFALLVCVYFKMAESVH